MQRCPWPCMSGEQSGGTSCQGPWKWNQFPPLPGSLSSASHNVWGCSHRVLSRAATWEMASAFTSRGGTYMDLPGPQGADPGGQWHKSSYSWLWLCPTDYECCFCSGKLFWHKGAPHLLPALSRLVSYKAGSWIASGFSLLVILGLFDVSPSFRPWLWKELILFLGQRKWPGHSNILSSKDPHICLLSCILCTNIYDDLKIFFLSLFSLSL